ncbi:MULTISPECIES: tetraprenyl-beta-curcumene synthase family protein [Brevibacillus]|uniref:tetraprenyl-beta-curcumene synthase family protein n=1 Tax=Brevibacillus TaxID=55080 RepID=UPI0020425A02|nr:tetraprenyl-beta-curcumene synthase family protein [Brevibacillus sp. AY1]MCM3079983.1 tetraprenyl-beta-curcumene synthase family protein [Brevibacillus invocatus]MCM3430176.1 tetraprenyl-beta-curcumene synthase family protein [Brevibacillus invocatus]MDH4616539.1 tetraprenyl-beta-curcumene synthase family protein [Brevibacillus sp. AY1]
MSELRNPWQLLYRVYRYVQPVLEREFAAWYKRAESIPNPELRKQALDSMNTKKFHCQGGCVYAAQVISHVETIVPLIVAYQTISDYLDNLCDRSTSLDPVDFRQLHVSMQDALTPGAPLRNYYQYREEQDDGGYLASLVQTCQHYAAQIPAYDKIQPRVLEFSVLYSDLQVYKHIHPALRENELLAWWDTHKEQRANLHWQEFAAVTGSTIGIFALFCLATDSDLGQEQVDEVSKAYFPWLCGLHILLDYLIDLEEDRLGGDLNFVSYYESEEEATERLQYFIKQAKTSVRRLPNPAFHRMIVDGLVAFYLADRKVNRTQPRIYTIARQLLKQAKGLPAVLFYVNSLLVRR